MCAILDANVVHEVIGKRGTEAGKGFLHWINCGPGRLVIGGRLLNELERASGDFKKWAKRAQAAGKIRRVDKGEVDAKEEYLRDISNYKSNDPHIIALAQISGARLLYSNDEDLQQDFNNKELIDNPRGKVYTTNNERTAFLPHHKRLLEEKDLCRANT